MNAPFIVGSPREPELTVRAIGLVVCGLIGAAIVQSQSRAGVVINYSTLLKNAAVRGLVGALKICAGFPSS